MLILFKFYYYIYTYMNTVQQMISSDINLNQRVKKKLCAIVRRPMFACRYSALRTLA